MPNEVKPLPFTTPLIGTSDKALSIHHDKLYAGYVTKKQETQEKLKALAKSGDLSTANQTYSELRGLKTGESFAVNGAYLHETYFDNLGGDGKPEGPLLDELIKEFGALESFLNYFNACGLAARGWVVLAWDMHDRALRVYSCDAHDQGGIWGCVPIIVLDVYEHAYFIDYGAERKAYIADYWKNFNWKKANGVFAGIQR